RRDLAVCEDLQGAPDDRERLCDRRRSGGRNRVTALHGRLAHAGEVLVGNELVAVALQDPARKRAAANDEHLLVVLLELLDEREEVAVTADDHVRVDVRVSKRHLERVEREIDVRAILVASRREVALHEADRVLGQGAAVLAGARPVRIRDLGDDLAALFDGVEDGADVELLIEGGSDPDLDVVEVDEDGDVETVLMRQTESLLADAARASLRRCSFYCRTARHERPKYVNSAEMAAAHRVQPRESA